MCPFICSCANLILLFIHIYDCSPCVYFHAVELMDFHASSCIIYGCSLFASRSLCDFLMDCSLLSSSLSFSQNVKGPVRVPEYNTGSHSTSQRASQDYTLKTYNMCAQALKARRDKLRREKLIKVSPDAS